MSDVIGSAEIEIGASRDKLRQDLREAEKDVKAFGDKAERDVGGSAGRITGSVGRMASVAGLAIGALVSAIGLAIVGAFNLGRAGQKMASDIAASSSRIGVGTAALQEWRHVAQQSGASADDADKALSGFARKFSEAASGLSADAKKAFGALGISQAQLRSFDTVEDALDTTVDRIGDLGSAADRAAIAQRLGLGPLSDALVRGADDIARMRDEAHALGVVMDRDLIERAAKAQQEFETLSSIISVQLATAFIDLAPVLNTAVNLIADAARQLGLFVDRFRQLENRTTGGLRSERARLVAEKDAIADAFGTRPLDGRTVITAKLPGVEYDRANLSREAQREAPVLPRRETRPGGNVFLPAGQHFDAVTNRIAEIDTLLASRSVSDAPRISAGGGGGSTLNIPPPRARVDRSAEREARRAERVEQEIFRARQRLLQVAEGDVLTAQQRYDLAQDQLKLDRQARDAEIDSKADRGEITDAERRTLDAANAQADALENRILTDSAFREIEDERLATERLMAGLASDLLSLQSGAARTAKERRAIELELLEIAQRQRRDALQLELDRDPSKTPAQRAEAMAANGRIDAAEQAAVIRNNMSPLEAWRDQSLKTADEISEAYESVAARGLDSLNDGIVDAIMNSKSLGDVFSNVARQILADLLKISVQKGITAPLAEALFGGGMGGGGGGWLSAIGSIFGGGRAGGGPMTGGNWYRVGEHGPENIVMPRDGFAIPNGQTGLPNGGTRTPVPAPLHFDLRGAVMTEDLLRQMEGMAAASGVRAVEIARKLAPADAARLSRYSAFKR